MAGFFTQLKNGLTAAQDVYGESFTLDTSLSVFKGVVDLESLGFPDDLGEFDEATESSYFFRIIISIMIVTIVPATTIAASTPKMSSPKIAIK
jgi:hypothetical protein